MNLFYASTAYHVLLSYMLALSDCENENNVLLLMGNSAANKTQSMFCSLFPKAFSKVICLECYPDHNNFKRLRIRKKNLQEIKSLVEELCTIDKFYYTCDWKVEVNYISHLLQNTGTEFHYYDDGMATYMRGYKQSPRVAALLSRVYFGKWRIVPKMEGLLNPSAHIHALMPELLPEIYPRETREKINPEKMLLEVKTENFPQELRRYADIKVELLIALPTVDEINNTFMTAMRKQIYETDKRNGIAAIKKHPRTKADNPIISQLRGDNALIDLPTEYSAEIYYLLFAKSLKNVVGFASTAIMTAKMLLPAAKVTALYTSKSLAVNHQKTLDFFENMGIKLEKIE